ncbi:MAG: hypothetical protein JRH11_04740 [Deltaproteobacteria bacterium]|nr:hypothetical protein [Deltaproteobacteria bacterium]
MRAFTVLPLLLALAAPSVACGGPEYVETEDTRSRTGRERRTQFVALDVRLLETGEEPREELRYRIEEGDQELAILGLRIGVQAGLGDPTRIEGGAPVFFTIESGPVEQIGHHIRYEVELIRQEQGSHPDHVESELDALHQIDGYVVVDERGITRDEHFDVPRSVPPRTATMIGNIFDSLELIPFPEEAVGPGAVWTVRETLDLTAYVVQQVVVYKLLERDGDDLKLEIVVTQTAEPQPLRELPRGMEAMIQIFEGDGRGTADVSLTRLVPHAEIDFNSMLEARGSGGQTLAMSTRTQVIVTPPPTEEAAPGQPPEAAPDDSEETQDAPAE